MADDVTRAGREGTTAKVADAVASRVVDRVLGDATPPALRDDAARRLAPWVERLVVLLDEQLRIPGTSIRVGLDPIVGLLVPGLGDALTGAGSLALLAIAWRQGVPTVALMRMVMNIALDAALGAVPIAGDVFDLFWRSNRRNLAIIEAYRADPTRRPSAADHALVALGVVLALASVIVPIALVYGLGLAALVAAGRALTGR